MGLMRAMVVLKRLKGWWSTHPSIDVLLTALTASLAGLLTWRYGLSFDVLGGIPEAEQSAVYIGLAQVVGLINAFSLAALTYMQAAQGKRMKLLRAHVGSAVTSSWLFAILGSLGVAGLLSGVGILSGARALPGARWLVALGLIYVSFASLRLGWVFVRVVQLSEDDLSDPLDLAGPSPPKIRRTASGEQPPPTGGPRPIESLKRRA